MASRGMTTSRTAPLMAVLLVVGSWFLSSNAHASLFVLKESSAAFDVVAAADPDAPSAIDVPGPDSQRLPRREGPHAVRNIEHPLGPARSLPVETSYVYDTLEGGTAATADDEPDEGADQAVLDADAEIDGQRHHYDRRTHVADTSADTDHHVARGPPSDKVLNAHDTTSNPVDPAGEPGWVRRAILGLGSESVTPSAASAVDDLLPGLPSSAPRPLGLGSTGRTAPADLTEQLAMTQVRSAPGGRVIPVAMTDARWPASAGWVKVSQRVNGEAPRLP